MANYTVGSRALASPHLGSTIANYFSVEALEFFGGEILNKKQILVWLILMGASFYLLRNISNGVFGLLDNGPMMLLMLLGLDPDGWIGEKLKKYNLNPVYVACCVAMMVNTLTDGIAAAGDPESSLFGVVLGCLVPIAFLPVVWRLRNARNESR